MEEKKERAAENTKPSQTPILVSACLLGTDCKYNGGNNLCAPVKALEKNYRIIPICPETLGGLTSPRQPAEIQNGRVFNTKGEELTEAFRTGAEKALAIGEEYGCNLAVLKANSPSCGFGEVYDGSFCHIKVAGNGIAAQLLLEHGYRILTEKELVAGSSIDDKLQSK